MHPWPPTISSHHSQVYHWTATSQNFQSRKIVTSSTVNAYNHFRFKTRFLSAISGVIPQAVSYYAFLVCAALSRKAPEVSQMPMNIFCATISWRFTFCWAFWSAEKGVEFDQRSSKLVDGSEEVDSEVLYHEWTASAINTAVLSPQEFKSAAMKALIHVTQWHRFKCASSSKLSSGFRVDLVICSAILARIKTLLI